MWAGNAIFNIKGKGSAGSVTITTTEYLGKNKKKVTMEDAFRAYNTMDEVIIDYLVQLKKNCQMLMKVCSLKMEPLKNLLMGFNTVGSALTPPPLIAEFVKYATKGYNDYGNSKIKLSASKNTPAKSAGTTLPKPEKIYGTINLQEVVIQGTSRAK